MWSLLVKKLFNKFACQRLRIKKLNGHDVHVVEGDNPKSLALLAKAYKEVYEAGFPIKEARESLDVWLDNLKDKQASVNITISILGENLDTSNPILKAMTIGYYYQNQDVGLLAYIVTAPAFMTQGLGSTLNDANNHALLQFAKNKKSQLKGIFLECNDPAKVSAQEDVMDPAVRIKIFEKWGAIVLPIDYVQPPLEKGAAKCDTLKLLAYPHPETGQYPTPEAIKAYITGIYTELAKYAGCSPKNNPDYTKTIKQINALKPLPAPKKKPPSPH